MEKHPQLALLTNVPAPYRVPVWNRLARSTGGNLEVRFIASSDARRRTWTVPAREMHFRWEFLCGGAQAGLRSAFAMLRFLAHRRPRAVICGGYNSLAAWVAFAWCKVMRRRFVLWLEGTTRDLRPKSSVRIRLKRLMVSRADAIAASGKATIEYVEKLGARRARIFVAPFGGDYRAFAREAVRVNVRAEKKARGYPAHLALYSGRLVREKGLRVLLEAFRRLSAELPEAGLMIVGDGPARAEMENLCREWRIPRVFFAGSHEYANMPAFYALANVLVLPTFSDTWGYVVNEAFACGVPAIVSRVAGVCDDLIVPGETGFVVEPGDSGGLAARMRLLLTDHGLRSRMSVNCLRAIAPYSAEACAQGLLAAVEGKQPGSQKPVRSQRAKQKPESRNRRRAALVSSF